MTKAAKSSKKVTKKDSQESLPSKPSENIPKKSIASSVKSEEEKSKKVKSVGSSKSDLKNKVKSVKENKNQNDGIKLKLKKPKKDKDNEITDHNENLEEFAEVSTSVESNKEGDEKTKDVKPLSQVKRKRSLEAYKRRRAAAKNNLKLKKSQVQTS